MSLFRFVLTCAEPFQFAVLHDGRTVIDVVGKDRALDEINHSFYRDHEVFRWKVKNGRCSIWVS